MYKVWKIKKKFTGRSKLMTGCFTYDSFSHWSVLKPINTLFFTNLVCPHPPSSLFISSSFSLLLLSPFSFLCCPPSAPHLHSPVRCRSASAPALGTVCSLLPTDVGAWCRFSRRHSEAVCACVFVCVWVREEERESWISVLFTEDQAVPWPGLRGLPRDSKSCRR